MTRKNNKVKIFKPKKSYTLKLKRNKKLVRFEKQLTYNFQEILKNGINDIFKYSGYYFGLCICSIKRDQFI